VDEFGIQASGWSWAGDGTDSITVESIVFTVIGDEEDAVYGTAPVDAPQEYTVTVYPSALTHDWTADGISYELGSDNRMSYVFEANNCDSRWNMPVSLDWSKVKNVTLNVKDHVGARPNVFFSTENGNKVETFGNAEVVSNAVSMTPTVTSGTVDEFGIQASGWSWAGDGTDSITVESIVFTVIGDGEDAVYGTAPVDAPQEYTVTVYPSALTHDWTADGISYELGSDNRMSYVFEANNCDSRWNMPVSLDWSKVKNVTLNVKDHVGARPNVFFSTENGNKVETFGNAEVVSNAVSMTPTVTSGTVDEFGIQASGWSWAGDGTDSITVESIVFTVIGDEEDAVYGTAPSDSTGGEEEDDTTETTYTGSELSVVATDKGATSAVEGTTAEIAFPETNAWVKYQFPESFSLDDCETVIVKVSSQVGPLNFYLGDDNWSKGFYGKSGSAEYVLDVANSTLTGTTDVMFVQLGGSSYEEGSSVVLESVTIKMSETTDEPQEPVETYELTFNAGEGENDLIFLSTIGGATQALEGNAHSLTFATFNSDEVKFTIPELINMEKCVSITVKVADQVGPMNYYFYSGSTKLGQKYYNPESADNQHVLEFNPKLTGKMDTLGVQLGGNEATEGAKIKILSVTFVMEGKKPVEAPTDGVYTYAHFADAEASEGTTVEVDDETLVASIDFAAAGDSVTLPIPDAIDVNHLVSIDMLAEGAENVKIVLLDKNGEEIDSATASSIETKCNPEVAAIQLVATDATSFELTGIAFNVDPNAFEAIVLNGYFAREDLSMWSKALWGTVDGTESGESTTITTATSDTAIYDDVYTYGVVSRRSSPYVCFAQDITERVTPGKTYSYSFWAKLSDDYVDAPANQREITFAPYYLDASGKEQYGLNPEGTVKMSLEPGKWTKFAGTVTVPVDATGFIIRIVEQGTNYGNGDCVLGSYAVTGVVMEEATASSGTTTSNVFNPASQEIKYSVTYEVEDLVIESSYGVVAEEYENGVELNYNGNYGEARFKLPRSLDMSKIVYIEVNMRDQNTPIAVKLYNKGQNEWVTYYNHYQSTYQVVPYNVGNINAVGIMCLTLHDTAYAAVESVTFHLTEEPAPLPVYDDIVLNGNFDIEDLADEWKASFWGDGVTITQKVSTSPIFGNVYTYGSYSRRTSPYQCFAQDITDRVEEGETYTFSFWARLSSDYVGAPANQRVVEFAPYTVDKAGNPDYNPKLEGTVKQTLEPGVWTKFEGTFKVYNANGVGQVIIRLLEQGTNYGQGDCVMGGYDVTGVVMEKYIPEPPSIDEDVPDLWKALEEDFGDDFMTGTAVTLSEIEDIGVEMLIGKHFNAVTIGNELKPDALFGYSNGSHTKLQTISFKGQNMVVPTLNYSRAEEVLDELLKWNAANPDNQVKVKGHVLVWHAQTPEWFFREGYVVKTNADGTPNYVSAEEMNLRLEWYIKTVLEHFLGEDSPYKDLFYAWDVVNEAVADGSGTYRTNKVSSSETPDADTHGSNSSWWAVYQSNEFIINAFKYANMYAPAHIELYYNDYNECDNSKVKGIVQLLTDVKAAEGTRIDGMGMQGHYNMFNPSTKGIEAAIRAYTAVVDKVVFSELDLKASGDISSETGLKSEYLAQAERYHDIYQLLLKLHKEGLNIGGITWWGTVDHHSWLQTSSSVGGGADGTMTQCPLLFDTNYKVKPSYWAFVNYLMVDPDWVPEEEVTKDEPKEDGKEEQPVEKDEPGSEDPKVENSSTAEDSKEDAEKTDAPAKDKKEEKSNALPIAVGGVAGLAVIAGGIFAFLKKKGRR